jgi:DNA-binding GntR family transcriptional regulator
LAAAAYQVLVQAIVTGTQAPGARIRDGELAAQLHISRMPAREALKRSESDGPAESVRTAIPVSRRFAPSAAQAFPVIAAPQAPARGPACRA